jgi:hypothetical protein
MTINIREALLRQEITHSLPDFAAACESDAEVVLIQQGAFAGNYDDPEYLLLGKAIKYAGLCGKNVTIVK